MTPFSTVDELGCYMDDPVEPNSIHLEARLAGRVEPARLRAAVLSTVDAHPAARARRGRWRGWDRRFQWEIAGKCDAAPVEQVCWRDEAELAHHRERLLGTTPPLDQAPPFRVLHAIGPANDVLITNTHHAAMDGMSCLLLLSAMARRYAGRTDELADGPHTTHHGRLPGPPAPFGGVRSLRPAARITPDRAKSGPGCGFHLVSWPLRTGARGLANTVNDLMVAALVTTVAAWNDAHGAPAATIRITMPIDARRADSAPIGNLSRLTVIASQPAHRGSPALLLAEITRQTSAAKLADGPQLDPVSRMLAAPLLPVAVKAGLVAGARLVVGAATSDTSLLSNLGAVDDPPDFGPAAPVQGLWMSSPVRMPRGLSVGAITVRGRLNLCFRYRRALFDDDAVARFAAMFRTALLSFGDPRFDPEDGP
jgi:NRPS condensation-like uncharacterized protein